MSRVKEFFHGTTHNIQGSHVLPLSERFPEDPPGWLHAQSHYPDLYKKQPWRTEHVFSTGSEAEAWSWSAGQGRHRVHVVKPEGRPTSEAHVSDEVTDERISRRARIMRTEWTPPPQTAKHFESENWRLEPHGGVQGTLPPVNWEQFHDTWAAHRMGQEQKAEERMERAKASVGRQDAYNADRQQGRLF